MIKLFKIELILITILVSQSLYSQEKTDTKAKYLSWSIMQLVPSPVLFQDSNNENAGIQFGLRWHFTPVNISFRANKYISPVQFLVINPVRRFTGSAELFIQPELTTSQFEYAKLSNFGISTGTRIILPLSGEGQNISFSLGIKYNYRKDLVNNDHTYWGSEAGIYFIYGILGVQFNYNFTEKTKYNIGFYFKYF